MEDRARLCYLDADMLVLQNIDFLFHASATGFWATPDCAAGRLTEAERADCALLHACNGKKPHYFNAGMFVMTPSVAELRDFEEALESGRCHVGGYAEQDFLNSYYKVRNMYTHIHIYWF